LRGANRNDAAILYVRRDSDIAGDGRDRLADAEEPMEENGIVLLARGNSRSLVRIEVGQLQESPWLHFANVCVCDQWQTLRTCRRFTE
jgi:hypothetical protein